MNNFVAWLEAALADARQDLPEEVEGYLLGRGVSERAVHLHEFGVWKRRSDPAPDQEHPTVAEFIERYDPKYTKRVGMADRLIGKLIRPIRSGKGDLLGFEARSLQEKRITQFLLPRAKWNPVFLGLFPWSMEKIWEGAQIWIVEGGFDGTALEQIIPERDVALPTLRARLSKSHVEFLRRFSRNMVNIAYDEDATGRKAAAGWIDEQGRRRWGAIESLDRVGVRCRDIRYRGGKDPCEIWERCGTEGLRKAFASVL